LDERRDYYHLFGEQGERVNEEIRKEEASAILVEK
jgi:hypothetical protein